jgi:hypothetical protein
MVLRNLGILSCGKMLGAVGAGIGLALGGFVSLMTIVAAVQQNFKSTASLQDALFVWGAFLFLPMLYGVMGFAVGIVGAFAYNVASSRLGGIELDLAPPAP